MRILIIKLRHHGDTLLITPVINSLRCSYPDCLIDVLLYEESRPMLSANPEVAQIHGIDRHWKQLNGWRRLQQEWRLARTLRRRGYHIVLNLSDQWRSALLTAITGAKTRIGFALYKRKNIVWHRCHTQLVSTEGHDQQHIVEQNLSICTPLALPVLCRQLTMSYCPQDWQHCQACGNLPVFHLADDNPVHNDIRHPIYNYIVIQPTARWYFKSWPESQVAEVINQLTQRGYQIILTAAPDSEEMQMITRILRQCQPPAPLSLAGQLTLRQLAALIDHARLFIGVDSVAMHMAAALQTPSVALFGASKLQHWHPWQAPSIVLWAGDYGTLPHPDTLDTHSLHRYLSLIPTKAVTDAALEMLTHEPHPTCTGQTKISP